MNRPHPFRRWRTQQALDRQTDLHELHSFADEWAAVEVRYLWYADELPDDGTVLWQGRGFYWRTGPGMTWTLAGVGWWKTRRWARSTVCTVTGEPRRRPLTPAEVLAGVASVASFVAVGVDVAKDVRDLIR